MRSRGSVTSPGLPGGIVGLVVVGVLATGCGGSDGQADSTAPVSAATSASAVGADHTGFVVDVLDAIDAVEDELGAPQEFFEVTANDRFANVFVAVDEATAAVAYAWVDGQLQPPAPKQQGAEGRTFGRGDVDFDPDLVTSGVRAELPDSEVDAISVYGDGAGATYVLAVTSPNGGFLDVVVGPDGQVLSVDPV